MKKNFWISCKDGKCDITLYLGDKDKPYKDVDADKMREALEEYIKAVGLE